MADEKDESKLELPSFGIFGGGKNKGKRRAGKDDDATSAKAPKAPKAEKPQKAAKPERAKRAKKADNSESQPTQAVPSEQVTEEAAPQEVDSREPAPQQTAPAEAPAAASVASAPASEETRTPEPAREPDTTPAAAAATAATAGATSSGSRGSHAARASEEAAPSAPSAESAPSSGTSGRAARSRPGVGEQMPQKPDDGEKKSRWSLAPSSPGASLKDKLPSFTGQVAAGVAGAVVGLVGVLLTYGALSACEAVRNTATCGSAGLPLLIAVLLLMVVVGRVLLGAWDVLDPTGTAFLAVGLIAVISLLFFTNILLQWYMIVLLPLVSVVAHLLSHYVTTAYVELDDDDYQKVSTT